MIVVPVGSLSWCYKQGDFIQSSITLYFFLAGLHQMWFFSLGEGNDLIDEDADKARAYIVGRYDRVSPFWLSHLY